MKMQMFRWLLRTVSLVAISSGVGADEDTSAWLWGIVPQGEGYPQAHFLNTTMAVSLGEDGCDLVWIMDNHGDKELWVETFLCNSHLVGFDEENHIHLAGINGGRTRSYNILPVGDCYILRVRMQLILQFHTPEAPFFGLLWLFSALNDEFTIGLDKLFFITAQSPEGYDFSSRFDVPDAVNLKIAKVLGEDNPYGFAFIVSNNTSETIEIDAFNAGGNRGALKFSDGGEYTFPAAPIAGTLELAAGESACHFFDLKAVLSESGTYSPASLPYGISELSFEVLLPDGKVVSASLPLVKFNQKPPSDDGYLMSSPPTGEDFRNNSFTLLEQYND